MPYFIKIIITPKMRILINGLLYTTLKLNLLNSASTNYLYL